MKQLVLIQSLRNALQDTLPGQEFQYRLAHTERRDTQLIPLRDDVRHAAVLILLFQVHTIWHTVFIRRKTIAGDVHAGQISFPGGRLQSGETPEDAALRESAEEIGSPVENVEILGQLTHIHIPVSNHLVFPVVAYLRDHQQWRLQESEVDMVLEAPLHHFRGETAPVYAAIRLQNGAVLENVPGYDVEGHFIWGATAMILSEFSALLARVW